MKKKLILLALSFLLIDTVGAGLTSYCESEEKSVNCRSVENKLIINNDPLKILFIGSSYFNFNDLPGLFDRLVEGSGKDVFVDHIGRNGMYLDDHASDPDTESKIFEQDWDYIVLQGVGTNTAYPDYFTDHPLHPALLVLQDKIFENNELTHMMYCLPWAFEDGMTWYQDWTDTYEDMQIKIFETTVNYSNDVGFQIAPVGWAWYNVLEEKEYPLHYLHLADWNHPSGKGSYLMACVIYSSIFIEGIVDNSFHGGLAEDEAIYFQNIASDIVLENLSIWNLIDTDNNPPEKPLRPSGPNQIKPKVVYSYTSMTTDVDSDNIYYMFDWGDGNRSDWLGPFYSGETVKCNYSWENKGSFEIRVKAKDEHNFFSSWSDPLQVNLSKAKKINRPEFTRLLFLLNLFFDDIKNFNCLFF